MSETENILEDRIILPAPTPGPIVMAFGVGLIFAGPLTNLSVSAVGLVIAICGAVTWWKAIFPQPSVIAIEPLEEDRPAEIAARPARVEHLIAGKVGHRVRIPERIHPYSAGAKGGLLGGVVMAIVAVAYGHFALGSIWYPVNLAAAIAMPSLQDATPELLNAFNGEALTLVICVHVMLSVLVGLLYGVLLPMLPGRHPLFGSLVAPLAWTGLTWSVIWLVNPAFQAGVNWPVFLLSQVLFAFTAAMVVARSTKVETLQTWPLAARAGIDAQEPHDSGPSDESGDARDDA